jgi:hypothetical protein
MAAQLHFGAGNSTTFGTTGTGGSGSASFTKATISNLVIGDLLVAWIHNQASGVAETITPPTGWTRYGAALGSPSSSVTRLSGFYYYAITSQDDIDNLDATCTWTFSAVVNRCACVVARATGIDLDDIEDSASTAFQNSSNNTDLTITGITTINPTTLLLAGIHHQNSASTTSPTVTSMLTAFLEHKTSPTGSANANSGGAMGYQYLTSAGATGNVLVTLDSAATVFAGELVAFKAGTWTPPDATPTRPTIVGTPTTFTSSGAITNFTINKPLGVVDGDLLILALSAQTPTATSDFASSGWTRISQSFLASSSGRRVIAFYALPVPTAASVSASSFAFTSTDSVSGGRIAATMYIVRGADLTNITAGGISPYGTSNAQTVTVQPTDVTANNSLLLVAYNAQFTSAIDYTIASGPSGMTQQTDLITATGAVSKTALAVYRQDVDAGAVTAKALSWTGLQSQTSGASVAIRDLNASNVGVTIQYTSALNTLADGQLYYTSALDTLSTPLEVRYMPEGYPSVNAMLAASPFYIAHRGGSDNWPEMSLHAYTQSVFWGVGALEMSLGRSSDGVWFGLHDATLDRTSGTTGFTASAHTWAEIQAYSITAAETDNSSQPVRPFMRWEEIIATYYPTHVLFVDPKAAYSFRSELLDMMDDCPGTPTDRFVAKYYGVVGPANNSSGWPFDASSRGYKTWGYFYQADAANFATYQGRWDILGMDYNADQTTWNSILSYGKPVIGHIVPSSGAATSALTKGADGLMVANVTAVVPRV